MSFDSTWEQIHRAREWSDQPEFWLPDVLRRRFDGNVTVGCIGVDVLDLGCGGGAISLMLAGGRLRVHAVDGAPSAVALTQRRLEKAGLSADVRVLDAERILEAFGPNSMDWVIDNACIQCCRPERQGRIVAQIRQVLRSGGWVYSRMASAGSWGDGTGMELAPSCYTGIPEGPAAGMGVTTFATRERIMELWGWLELAGNRITQDHRHVSESKYGCAPDQHGIRTDDGGAWHWWMEWVVEGRKPFEEVQP